MRIPTRTPLAWAGLPLILPLLFLSSCEGNSRQLREENRELWRELHRLELQVVKLQAQHSKGAVTRLDDMTYAKAIGARKRLGKVSEEEPEEPVMVDEPEEEPEEPVMVDEPEEEPEEPVEEPVRDLRAGGAYGGRSHGRKGLDARGGAGGAKAIYAGLEWLKRVQRTDGRWTSSNDGGAPNKKRTTNDVGATALALLAFLGDGSTMRSGPYKTQVKKGISWLVDQQQESGLIGQASGHSFHYSHALATLAMAEAYGLSRYAILKRKVQRAVDYIEKARNPYKVWRYYPKDGQNDSSLTGWMVAALFSAKQFRIRVNAQSLKAALSWYEEVTDTRTGKVGYTKRGEPSSRLATTAERFPSSRVEALTASGLYSRILLGQSPRTSPILRKSADAILKKLPKWNRKSGSIDFYYWYFGSYAMFQMGGVHWKKWRGALQQALLPHQVKRDAGRGSWDPSGAWGTEGGRVYSTALAVLCLEAYYRYTRLIR